MRNGRSGAGGGHGAVPGGLNPPGAVGTARGGVLGWFWAGLKPWGRGLRGASWALWGGSAGRGGAWCTRGGGGGVRPLGGGLRGSEGCREGGGRGKSTGSLWGGLWGESVGAESIGGLLGGR